eukprot:TRINITY_DN1010_c0_g1_i1.p1 TRINITY_DN1010_c0_g1~~TRINITY_DN1010_c0_g1_i1.p1  ORF type:complete len:624 (+),score=146.97 TRINITY_DN1010_c0_g1_i1:431-2302(+)
MTVVLVSEGAGMLMSPLAGVLVDRYNRKRLMVSCNIVAGLGCVCFYITIKDYWSHYFGITALSLHNILHSTSTVTATPSSSDLWSYWPIILASAFLSSLATIEQLSFASTTSTLSPNKQLLPRISGALQIGPTTGSMLAPMITAGLLTLLHCEGIILGQGCTLLLSALLIGLSPLHDELKSPVEKRSGLRDFYFFEATEFLKTKHSLQLLIVMATAAAASAGISQSLLGMLILAFPRGHYAQGVLVTFTSAAAVLGSLLMALWGDRMKDKPMKWALGACLVRGGFVALCGWMWWGPPTLITSPTIPTCVFATASHLVTPIAKVSMEAGLQRKLPWYLRGRIYSLISMLCRASGLLGMTAAMSLAERVFEPLFLHPPTWAFGGVPDNMHEDQHNSGSFGWMARAVVRWLNTWIGFGPGKGVSVMLVLIGLIQMMFTILLAKGVFKFHDLQDVILPQEQRRIAHEKALQEKKEKDDFLKRISAPKFVVFKYEQRSNEDDDDEQKQKKKTPTTTTVAATGKKSTLASNDEGKKEDTNDNYDEQEEEEEEKGSKYGEIAIAKKKSKAQQKQQKQKATGAVDRIVGEEQQYNRASLFRSDSHLPYHRKKRVTSLILTSSPNQNPSNDH